MRDKSKSTLAGSASVGQLCIGGDWACAHGNLETLQFLARSIAELTPEPQRREVAELALRCATDPEHAVEAWVVLTDRVRSLRHC